MAEFTARLDLREFETRIAILKRPQAPIVRALNRSMASAKTAAVRLISQDMGLKASDVRDLVRVEEATPTRLTARLFASAKRIPLIRLGAKGREPSRGRPPGVRVRMKGGAGIYPQAFIATMPSGHRGVFQRKVRLKGPRLPIHELRGPSIWQAFQKHQAAAAARAQEQLGKNLEHEVTFALSR